MHTNLQILGSSRPDDAGNLHSLRHFHNSDGVRCHVFELWWGDVDDCVSDEFSFLAQFDPFDPAMSTVGTDGSGRDHHLPASYAPNGHELPLATVLVEFLDGGIS